MKELTDILISEDCSLVMRTATGKIRKFHGRGVEDLYKLLNDEPAALRGAEIADKVVGRGAATLMILGGVAKLYTPVLSEKAAEILAASDVCYSYDKLVPNIINRRGDGICPVEALTSTAGSVKEAYKLITKFITDQRKKKGAGNA